MSLNFEETHYYKMVNPDETEIKNTIENEAPFKYGKVCYSEFKEGYNGKENQLARKFVALPAGCMVDCSKNNSELRACYP